jgi:5'-nucleotidase
MAESKGTLRVLVVNDDGIAAQGIVELARALSPLCIVTVVAPESPRSAASHSITLHKPLRVRPVGGFTWPNKAVAGCAAYSTSGSPADGTMLGVLEVLKDAPPHLIVSGINDGQNLAEDVTYSGTVAGAMEGAILGLPSIAISLDSRGRGHFATASHYLLHVLRKLLYAEPPEGVWPAPDTESAALKAVFDGSRFLNINVPDVPVSEIKGIRSCFTGFRGYKDVIQKMVDPRGEPFYWIAGERVVGDMRNGSDVKAASEGYVTVTPLTWDLTDVNGLALLKSVVDEDTQPG